MGNTHYSGPVYSEGGYKVVPIGSAGYYMAEDPADGKFKIGAGGTVGSQVGLTIDSSGNVSVSADVDLSQIDLGDGLVSAPSLAFQSADNTGLFYSAGSLKAAVGGVEGISIDASRNISVPSGNVTVSRSLDSAAVQMIVGNTSVTAPQAIIRVQSQDENRIELLNTGGGGERMVLEWKANQFRLGTSNLPENETVLFADDATKAIALGNSVYPNVTIGVSAKVRADTTGLGFYNTTPVAQAAHIVDAPGDTAANNATTINAILVALENIGITAAS